MPGGGGGGGGSRVAKEELIPVELVVKRIGRTDIEIVYRRDEAFLPLLAMFNYLRIKADYRPANNVVEGFYPDPSTEYSIDLVAGKARRGDITISLSQDDFAFSEDEVYLRDRIYKELFDLEFRYEQRRLSVTLVPPSTLPIYGMRARERARNRAFDQQVRIQPEVRFPRSPSLFEFGKLNWTLSTRNAEAATPRYSYNLRYGGKIFAGDLDLSIRGIGGKRVRENDLHGVLHYPFEDMPYLRDIRLGDVAPGGVSFRRILGVEVTNRPPGRRLVLSNLDVEGKFPSNHEVEFYDRGLLINYVQTQSESTYQFSFPLAYGVGDYEFRMFDQWGEPKRQAFRAVVPQSMLPPNELQYSVIGGKLRGFNTKYGNVSLGRGFTTALTLGTGTEVFEQGATRRSIYPFVNGTVRLMNSLTGEVFVSPLAVSQASLNMQFTSYAQVTLSHSVHQQDVFLNPGRVQNLTTFFFYAPFIINTTRLSFSGLVTNTLTTLSRQRSVFGTMDIHWPNIQFIYNISYTRLRDNLDERTLTLSSRLDLSVLAPAEMVFRSGFVYDHQGNGFRSVHVGLERLLFRSVFLQLSFERNFKPSLTFAFLRLNFYLPYVRIFSTAIRSTREGENQGITVSNTIRSSILGSSSTGDYLFYPLQRADRGAFLFRPFIDLNANDQHDEGEEYLPKSRVIARTRYLTSSSQVTSRGTMVTNVEPYQDYTAYLDIRLLDNALWIPKYKAVTITGEPNYLKIFDYPIVVGGNVRGKVTYSLDGSTEIISGLTIVLRPAGVVGKERTTKTFSNGEFEFIGVPPGTYEVTLDEVELGPLGLAPLTLVREVVVSPHPDGDLVTGIDFDLRQR